MSTNRTSQQLLQPPAYRQWDTKRHTYFYTDALPDPGSPIERWTGLFDKQGLPLYENDIIRVHYDWQFGWVRALIVRHAGGHQFSAQAAAPHGTTLRIGFYCFSDSYRIGNLREHPAKLVSAREQFAQDREPWWASPALTRGFQGSCRN